MRSKAYYLMPNNIEAKDMCFMNIVKLTRLISVCLFGPGGQGLLLHSLIKSFRSSAARMEYEMGTFSFGLILICSILTIKGLTLREKKER